VVISQNKSVATSIVAGPVVNDRWKIDSLKWKTVEEAILERLEAVELFLADVAGKFRFQRMLESFGASNNAIINAREHLATALPSFQRRVWLAAVDLVCDTKGQMWFVDDHFCCPYGLNTFSRLLGNLDNEYLSRQFDDFTSIARRSIQQFMGDESTAVVLGSSTFNTTYRENHYLAEFLGIPFMSQRQLTMQRQGLFQSNASAGHKVCLVIRRLQDDDLDPNCFRAESLQGVRGLVRGARRGLVTVLNAPGTGILNSRRVSRLIPQMIRFYLGKEPTLPTVPTIDASDQAVRSAAIRNMNDYIFRTDNSMDVLKPLVAEVSSREQRTSYLRQMETSPEKFVIRRTLNSMCGDLVAPVYSLRTFCVGTSDRTVLRGGIQRSCHADGTPTGPVTQDQSASLVGIN